MFRVIVQESRLTPTSGKIVAMLGSYDPHTKAVSLEKEKASFYLQHGAQPSDRVASLLQKEGVDLPKWVTPSSNKNRTIRNPAKLRRNQPEDQKVSDTSETQATEQTEEIVETEIAAPEAAPADVGPEVVTGTTES